MPGTMSLPGVGWVMPGHRSLLGVGMPCPRFLLGWVYLVPGPFQVCWGGYASSPRSFWGWWLCMYTTSKGHPPILTSSGAYIC